MFWPRVIAAPLWHSCSVDHLKLNEMWWGGIKGQSPPCLSSILPPPFLPFLPSSHNPQQHRQSRAGPRGTKCYPGRFSVLEPSPGLTQESSKCQYDFVNISLFVSEVLPCFKGLQLCTSLFLTSLSFHFVFLKSFFFPI